MRTDELRTVLREHGEGAHDLGAPARTRAVHQRVRTVRRRRAAVAGGGLAAAVAAVALGVVPSLTPVDPGPANAPRELAGFEVPREEVATGYTYEYARGVQADASDGPLVLRLPASNQPRLVMWASTAAQDGRPLELRDTGAGASLVRRPGAFSDYRLLPPGPSSRVVLRQPGAGPDDRIALALFELSDERPDGVTRHGVTFRARQLDDRLLGAVVGDRGDSEVTLELTVPERELRVSELCAAPDAGPGTEYLATLLVEGEAMFSSSCATELPYDAGTDGSPLSEQLRSMGVSAGDSVEVTLRLVDRQNRRIENPDVVLALGGYEEGGEGVEAAGWTFPERLEYDGHEWALATVGESDPGQRSYTTAMQGGSDRPVAVATGRSGLADGGRVRFSADGQAQSVYANDSGSVSGSWSVDTVLEPRAGHTATLTVRRGLDDRTRLGLGFYELVH